MHTCVQINKHNDKFNKLQKPKKPISIIVLQRTNPYSDLKFISLLHKCSLYFFSVTNHYNLNVIMYSLVATLKNGKKKSQGSGDMVQENYLYSMNHVF